AGNPARTRTVLGVCGQAGWEGANRMAESMRGSRLGAVSYENEGGVEFAPRQLVAFDCPEGHAFAVPFSVEAELPAAWECRVCGAIANRRNGDGNDVKAGRKPRTPWDMLLERRTIG